MQENVDVRAERDKLDPFKEFKTARANVREVMPVHDKVDALDSHVKRVTIRSNETVFVTRNT